jgi:Fur family transcriptional regulator, stress-responsive regulator
VACESSRVPRDSTIAEAARTISRATVYNVLRELATLGEVLEVAAEGRAKRYDPNARDPHQHLRCERCGTIRDVHPDGERSLRLPAAERYDFAITGVDIVFRGLCPKCAGARRATKPKRSARV